MKNRNELLNEKWLEARLHIGFQISNNTTDENGCSVTEQFNPEWIKLHEIDEHWERNTSGFDVNSLTDEEFTELFENGHIELEPVIRII
jgi:hypothetical protein